MEAHQDIIRVLRDEGYRAEQDNIADFWFSDRDRLAQVVDSYFPEQRLAFELRVRWQSDLGKDAEKALHEFVRKAAKKNIRKAEQRKWLNNRGEQSNKLKLADFYFEHGGKVFNLKELAEEFPTKAPEGLFDLRGMSFRGMELSGLEIADTALDYACFRESTLINTTFLKSSIERADFRKAVLLNVHFCNESNLDGADVRAAYVSNLLNLNNENLREPLRYSTVGYLWLLQKTLLNAVRPKSLVASVKGHSDHSIFLGNDLVDVSLQNTRPMRDYIEWYQLTINKISTLHHMPLAKRLGFIAALVFTKNWSSYEVLALMAFLINVFFSLVFVSIDSQFAGIHGDPLKAFYFSVVTFTTLGYGDVIPLTPLARLLVVVEVITGYIMSGIFIFLVGHLVGKRL